MYAHLFREKEKSMVETILEEIKGRAHSHPENDEFWRYYIDAIFIKGGVEVPSGLFHLLFEGDDFGSYDGSGLVSVDGEIINFNIVYDYEDPKFPQVLEFVYLSEAYVVTPGEYIYIASGSYNPGIKKIVVTDEGIEKSSILEVDEFEIIDKNEARTCLNGLRISGEVIKKVLSVIGKA